MKDFVFLNVSFIVVYSSLFLFKTDIFMILFFVYMLIINFYYFLKIEKLKVHRDELIDMVKDWEYAYSKQVKLNNRLTTEILEIRKDFNIYEEEQE